MDFLTQLDHNFIDVNVLFFIQEYLRFEWMTPIWKFITWLGDAGWFWICLLYTSFRGDSGTDQRENYFCIGAGNIDGLGKNSSSIGVYGRVRKENF